MTSTVTAGCIFMISQIISTLQFQLWITVVYSPLPYWGQYHKVSWCKHYPTVISMFLQPSNTYLGMVTPPQCLSSLLPRPCVGFLHSISVELLCHLNTCAFLKENYTCQALFKEQSVQKRFLTSCFFF